MKELLVERSLRKSVKEGAELVAGEVRSTLASVAIEDGKAGIGRVLKELVFDHELNKHGIAVRTNCWCFGNNKAQIESQ